MIIKQRFKPSLLAVLVTAYCAAPVFANEVVTCPADTQCETVIKNDGSAGYSGNDIIVSEGNGLQYEGIINDKQSLYLKNNIRVSGVNANAIYVAKDTTFSGGNLYIENGVDVISSNGTAIKIDGDFYQVDPTKPNMGIYIKAGSTVSGAVNAIDFSVSKSNLRIDVEGNVIGNIIGNGIKDNKINFGYGGASFKNASFDGALISGVGLINNEGHLTLMAQQGGMTWDADYAQKKDTSLTFTAGQGMNFDDPLLYITGKATFAENSQVNFAYTGSSINDILGKNIVLLEAEEGIINGSNVIVDAETGTSALDASPLLIVDDSWLGSSDPEFNGGVAGNQLIVRYAVNYNGADDFISQVAAGGGSASEVATANYMVNYALDTHNGTGSEASAQLLALLASAGTDAAKTAQLADELTPDAEGSELRAALLMLDKMRSQVDDRTNVLRNQSALGTAHDGWNTWVQTMFSQGSQDDSSAVKGYDIDRIGLNIGVDRVFNKENLIGFSLAYSNSSIELANSADTNEVDTLQAMIYGGWFDERYFIDANINVGRSAIDSSRVIGASTGYEGDTEATAEYSSLQIGYQLMAGMKFDFDSVQFEPRIAYNYQWLSTDDYEEEGSPASLRYDRQNYSIAQFGIGYNLFTTFQLSGGQFTPSLAMMAYKDLNDGEVFRETATLAMDTSKHSFTVTGDQVAGDMLEIKLNGHLQMENNFSIAGGVNFYQREDYDELMLGASLVKRF